MVTVPVYCPCLLRLRRPAFARHIICHFTHPDVLDAQVPGNSGQFCGSRCCPEKYRVSMTPNFVQNLYTNCPITGRGPFTRPFLAWVSFWTFPTFLASSSSMPLDGLPRGKDTSPFTQKTLLILGLHHPHPMRLSFHQHCGVLSGRSHARILPKIGGPAVFVKQSGPDGQSRCIEVLDKSIFLRGLKGFPFMRQGKAAGVVAVFRIPRMPAAPFWAVQDSAGVPRPPWPWTRARFRSGVSLTGLLTIIGNSGGARGNVGRCREMNHHVPGSRTERPVPGFGRPDRCSS